MLELFSDTGKVKMGVHVLKYYGGSYYGFVLPSTINPYKFGPLSKGQLIETYGAANVYWRCK